MDLGVGPHGGTGEFPAYDTDSPYEGGWRIGDCSDSIEATGTRPGMVVPNVVYTDQFGEPLALYDFCDRAVYVEFVAAWCVSCQKSAPKISALYETYASRGAMVITVLGESAEREPPDAADIQAWVQSFELRHPVVADPSRSSIELLFPELLSAGSYAVPAGKLLAPGMIVHSGPYARAEQLAEILP